MTERPTTPVVTPFGPMNAVFIGNGQISLRDRSEQTWNEPTKTWVSHDPISINGVPYRASFTGQKSPTGEWVENYTSIDKVGSVKAFDYSSAALRKFKAAMLIICAEVEERFPELLRAGEIAHLTDEFTRATQKAEKLAGELAQAEADVRRTREELTAAQAEAGQLDSEHMERRYLTRRELSKLAEHASTEQFAGYLTNYPHAIGNGACLEVALSVAQAREVDSLCELFQISQ